MKCLSSNKFHYCFIKSFPLFFPSKKILCLICRPHLVENYGVFHTSCTPYIVHLSDSPSDFSNMRTLRKFQFNFSILGHVVFSTHIILIILNLKSLGFLIGYQLNFHKHKVYLQNCFSTCSCPFYPIHKNDERLICIQFFPLSSILVSFHFGKG